jgi:hypothetical protein
MTRSRKQQREAAGKPAVAHNPRKLTDQHRAMVEMRKTASLRETAEHFRVPVSQVSWAESVWCWHHKGAALLAADPESLEGLSLTGQLDHSLADVLQYFFGTDQHPAYSPDYPCYSRISDVLMAGEKAIRSRVGMGPARWAEWLAFMQARGLEWGKPLSLEPPNAPAKPLEPGWNVYQFPSGECRASGQSRNGKIRQRLIALYREVECFHRLVADAIPLPKVNDFLIVRTGLDGVWDELVKAGIFAAEEPQP